MIIRFIDCFDDTDPEWVLSRKNMGAFIPSYYVWSIAVMTGTISNSYRIADRPGFSVMRINGESNAN